MKILLLLGAALFSLLGPSSAFAGSATWNLNPGDGDWNKPANWTPATVPNGPGDIATFDFSNLPSVGLSANTEVGSLVFNPGAAIYSITPRPGNVLTISDTGITNNSGQLQSFATMVDGHGNQGRIFLTNSAAAGSSTAFINNGGGFLGGETDFFDTATADNGTFRNSGGGVFGGLTQFFDSSTAGNGTFTNLSGAPLGGAGHTRFFGTSTAGHATITNEAAGSSGVTPPRALSPSTTCRTPPKVSLPAMAPKWLLATGPSRRLTPPRALATQLSSLTEEAVSAPSAPLHYSWVVRPRAMLCSSPMATPVRVPAA